MTTHYYTRRLLLITITRLEMYLKTTHILLIQTRIDWKKKKKNWKKSCTECFKKNIEIIFIQTYK